MDICTHRAIDLANSIETETPHPISIPSLSHSAAFASECGVYYLGKSLYDLREFRRAAHALRSCESDEAFFLRSYCLYLVRVEPLSVHVTMWICVTRVGAIIKHQPFHLKRENKGQHSISLPLALDSLMFLLIPCKMYVECWPDPFPLGGNLVPKL